jgi:hypothetical protein
VLLLLLDRIGLIYFELYFCHYHVPRQALVLTVFSLYVLLIVISYINLFMFLERFVSSLYHETHGVGY